MDDFNRKEVTADMTSKRILSKKKKTCSFNLKLMSIRVG